MDASVFQFDLAARQDRCVAGHALVSEDKLLARFYVALLKEVSEIERLHRTWILPGGVSERFQRSFGNVLRRLILEAEVLEPVVNLRVPILDTIMITAEVFNQHVVRPTVDPLYCSKVPPGKPSECHRRPNELFDAIEHVVPLTIALTEDLKVSKAVNVPCLPNVHE
jgi:hypothetical protein